MAEIDEFGVTAIDGTPVPMSQYAGQVRLIVNTASRCGFTPQYAGLERMHKRYGERGLAVLGFPCNQFGSQEPADDTEIAAFCSTTCEVGFPMFAEVEVNGPNTDPLFAYLARAARGLLGSEAIKWNFTKFLVARDGRVVWRFAPTTKPEALQGGVEKLLLG